MYEFELSVFTVSCAEYLHHLRQETHSTGSTGNLQVYGLSCCSGEFQFNLLRLLLVTIALVVIGERRKRNWEGERVECQQS